MSTFLSIVGSSLRNVPDLEPTVGCFCASPLWHLLTLSSTLLLAILLPEIVDLFILLAALDFGEDFLLGLSELCEFCVSFLSLLVLRGVFVLICRVLKGTTVFISLPGTSGVFAASNKFLRKFGEP